MNLRALVWAFPPSRSRHAGGCPEPPNRTARTRERRSATAPAPLPRTRERDERAIQGRPAAFRTRPAWTHGAAASKKNHARSAWAHEPGRVGLGRTPPAKRIHGGDIGPGACGWPQPRDKKSPRPCGESSSASWKREARTQQRTSFEMTPRAIAGRCKGITKRYPVPPARRASAFDVDSRPLVCRPCAEWPATERRPGAAPPTAARKDKPIKERGRPALSALRSVRRAQLTALPYCRYCRFFLTPARRVRVLYPYILFTIFFN